MMFSDFGLYSDFDRGGKRLGKLCDAPKHFELPLSGSLVTKDGIMIKYERGI